MSDTVQFQRRDFLKLIGLGVAGAASGCAQPADHLMPYLVQPNDVLPGIPYYFATTCRECPCGCGVIAKQREGRAIKVEGNPQHPVNGGGLCARGQSSLQGLYNPDRLKTPMIRDGANWKATTWDEALALATAKLSGARGKAALVTDHVSGSLHALAAEWSRGAGATHLVYEPFAYESLREANRRTFGTSAIADVDFARSEMLVSFGADFLETWMNPVRNARGFAAFRAKAFSGSGRFVAIEPRQSLTGANADEWIAVRPGGEMALALAMTHVLIEEGLAKVATAGAREAVAAFAPEAVSELTDVTAERIRELARAFVARAPSLAVAGGISTQSDQAVALLAAVNLLNWVAGNVGETVRFDRAVDFDAVAPFAEVQNLIGAMGEGRIEALVVIGANPVYATPAWAGFAAALDKVPFKLALATTLDETVAHCDLVLPIRHGLESWGDSEVLRGVHSLQQPGMKHVPMFESRETGDVLIALAKSAGFGANYPDAWLDYLKARWATHHKRLGGGRSWDDFWADALQAGGVWEDAGAINVRWAGAPAFANPTLDGAGDLALLLYPSANLFDGRGANKAWLQELPDPTTKVVWGSWAELHPETAAKLGVKMGDAVSVTTEAGAVTLPAYLYDGIRPDAVAIPLGQGHTAYGRYANGRGVSALGLLSPSQDAASGAVAYLRSRAKVARASQAVDLTMSQLEKHQHDRGIAQVVPLAAIAGLAGAAAHGAAGGAAASGHAAGGHGHHVEFPMATKPGRNTEPMARPEGWKPPAHAVSAFEPAEKARHPRNNPVTEGSYKNAKHRWAMAIDLHRCNGCSACVVGCYAENNIPTVGPAMVKRGREMAWIRIERFEESLGPGKKNDVRHIPMMCQHCGDAPCEIVCPVYATYHNPEGLNAQIYNRCVGTRYCSNNCPYKVRAFNFFDYSAPEKDTFAFPEPLNWQLNPDVTVRSKGVMEKCTMCVQRILEVKGTARDEHRDVHDGEINTACAQSCPTEAIVFGDLMDDESKVSKLSRRDDRRYWVFGELNTKPGVTYLKKVTPEA
ncbi:MAG: molybdopterin-dependent oxidoreductase [Candidatus Eisenbacteria bacterium]|uniref:Molybdopterin-dependent oxidoreductase n=1 Tax=Eiseniibacteriota bacterium TaxID=2212470 RepID=A0A849SPV1_UNCEI|nr:molybdopterin-dependent oxidoreductase [Candidatus Eisenbacteria bacterium]